MSASEASVPNSARLPRVAYRADRPAGLVILGVLLLLIAIPFAMAQVGGEDMVCAKGATPLSTLLMVELGIVTAGALALGAMGNRITNTWLTPLVRDRWNIVAATALIAMPFMIAAFTETGVCPRGGIAFFWESILIEMFILAIMAVSYNLLFGFTGVVSFGHAAFFGIGAYTAGILTRHFEWAWLPAVAATLALGVLVALIMGVVGLRLKGLYFAMFTLAFAEVLFLLAANRIMVDLTGAEDGLTFDVPDILNSTSNRLFVYYMVLALFVVSFIIVRRLMHSPTGRVLSAIRDNEARAQMLGYNVFHYKLIAMVISGLLATLAGLLMGIANKGANPGLLGVGTTVDALLQTIIGGLATFVGPIVGAFSLHLIAHLLRDTVLTFGETTIDIGKSWALVLGVIFILAVLAFPQGIVGTAQLKRLHTLDGWLRWLRIRR